MEVLLGPLDFHIFSWKIVKRKLGFVRKSQKMMFKGNKMGRPFDDQNFCLFLRYFYLNVHCETYTVIHFLFLVTKFSWNSLADLST